MRFAINKLRDSLSKIELLLLKYSILVKIYIYVNDFDNVGNNFDYVFRKTSQMLRVSSLVVPMSLFLPFHFWEAATGRKKT